jgi:hypothetical protein
MNSDNFLSQIANNLANLMAGELGIVFSVSDLVARQIANRYPVGTGASDQSCSRCLEQWRCHLVCSKPLSWILTL